MEEWEDILPGYLTFYPSCFRQVIPYLLASLIYHMDYLVVTLPKDHPLFIQRVWTSGIMKRLKDKVLSGCGRNEQSKMFATGIPPHIILANQIIILENRLDNFREQVYLVNNIIQP